METCWTLCMMCSALSHIKNEMTNTLGLWINMDHLGLAQNLSECSIKTEHLVRSLHEFGFLLGFFFFLIIWYARKSYQLCKSQLNLEFWMDCSTIFFFFFWVFVSRRIQSLFTTLKVWKHNLTYSSSTDAKRKKTLWKMILWSALN